MPLPSMVRIDRQLTSAIIGSKNTSYIAQNLIPVIRPTELSGKIAKMGREHYRIDFNSRSANARAVRLDYTASTVDYKAEEWSVEHPVDDFMRAQFQSPFDAFREAAMICEANIWLKIEDLVATLLTTAANYALKDATARNWDTTPTAGIIADVETAKLAIIQKSGISEDLLHGFCSYAVYSKLRQSSELQAAWVQAGEGRTTPKSMSAQRVADAMGLASLQVGSAVKNTAGEGLAESMSFLWGADGFGIFAKTPQPSIMRPNFGYILAPSVAGLPKGATVAVDRYREDQTKSTVVRATGIMDQIVSDTNFGYWFSDVLA